MKTVSRPAAALLAVLCAGSAQAAREFVDDAGRRVVLPDRIERVSKILYPGIFRHDLRKEVAQFHRRFYQREPTPEQIDRLLAEPGVAPR